MKIQTKVKTLMNKVRDLLLKYPEQIKLQMVFRNLELLDQELSLNSPNKTKINQIHYGLIRIFQDLNEFEKKLFGEEVDELLVDLNKY